MEDEVEARHDSGVCRFQFDELNAMQSTNLASTQANDIKPAMASERQTLRLQTQTPTCC